MDKLGRWFRIRLDFCIDCSTEDDNTPVIYQIHGNYCSPKELMGFGLGYNLWISEQDIIDKFILLLTKWRYHAIAMEEAWDQAQLVLREDL